MNRRIFISRSAALEKQKDLTPPPAFLYSLMVRHYIKYCWLIFLKSREPFRPPYVYFLGKFGEKLYQTHYIIFTYFLIMVGFSIMSLGLLTESDPKYYSGFGLLLFFLVQLIAFSFYRYIANNQHLNAHPKLISLYPISSSRRYRLFLAGEFFSPGILLILVIGLPFVLFFDCTSLIKLKVLVFLISSHAFLTAFFALIPRSSVNSAAFNISQIPLSMAFIFLLMAIFEEQKEIDFLNTAIQNIFNHHFEVFILIPAILMYITYLFRDKLIGARG